MHVGSTADVISGGIYVNAVKSPYVNIIHTRAARDGRQPKLSFGS